ncbi:MAG: hypothetical protein ABS43_10055 [Bordetella sp. SCN 67-23]|nr:FecR domain-containing protein [Burkholderiales bacterium]ODS74352.1 MAG: hypothetical protein ABS43_10055 [Bordetella sp. SCN 67-23]ODU81862.1 MAG: hypothetical protein ABT00_11260 [Bordetella sp. SCN 68-11]OJW89614.1 MAG: hypothetical protein BGO71_20505 [Burkholderiales bacterium 67-32]
MPADSSAAPEAFEWMLKLRSGGLTAEQQSTFERWLAVSANAEAWARLNRKLDDTFGPVRQFQASHPSMGLAARKAVLQPGRRRNWIKGALVVSGIGFGAGVLLDRSIPLATLGADYRTATGERRTVVLPDGSVLALNARSAVNVRFERGQRTIRLLRGEILVSATTRPEAPFVVETGLGTVRALGTRFLVRLRDRMGLVAVLEHSVRVGTASGHRVLAEGESAWFGPTGIAVARVDALAQARWSQGYIEVRDEPLGRVIDGLRPYTTAVLRVSQEAAELRALGVYPLDDPDAVLVALAETLPLRVRRYGPWLVTINVR